MLLALVVGSFVGALSLVVAAVLLLRKARRAGDDVRLRYRLAAAVLLLAACGAGVVSYRLWSFWATPLDLTGTWK